jgi:hypothetical protein
MTRETIDYFESRLTSEELEGHARMYEGALFADDDPRGGSASEFEWIFDPAFPVDDIHAPSCGWQAWFDQEIKFLHEELDGARTWKRLSEEEIEEAIIVVREAGEAWIWDGSHRTAGSVVAGRSTIPAIVGVRQYVPRHTPRL